MSNGIPIKSFMGEKNDTELMYMVSYLEEIYSQKDVRTHIADTFKLEEIVERFGKNDQAPKLKHAGK